MALDTIKGVNNFSMPVKKKNTAPKKSSKEKPKARISHKVKDYGNDPFILKKVKESKEFLEKHGFPEELVPKK